MREPGSRSRVTLKIPPHYLSTQCRRTSPNFGTPLPSPSVPRNGSKTFEGLCGDQNTAARRLLLLPLGGGGGPVRADSRENHGHTHTHTHTRTTNTQQTPTPSSPRWPRTGTDPGDFLGAGTQRDGQPRTARDGQRPTDYCQWALVACPRAPPSNPRVAAARLTWAAIDPRYSPSDTLTRSRNCHSRTHLAPVRSYVHEQAETRTG